MKLRIALCSRLYLMLGLSAFAQNIKLNNLAKIEFISSTPFWVGAYLHVVEVLPEGNVWNSYQLRRYQERPKPVRDSVRHFIRAVPEKDLKQLLVYINRPDTTIRLREFKIPKKALNRCIDDVQAFAKSSLKMRSDKRDSLTANLTAEQIVYYKKIAASKQAVKDAALKALHPFFNDDRSYFAMIFTYKDKHTDTVSAYVNDSHLYHLPWRIHNRNNYNPYLSELFESIGGDDKFAEKQLNRFVFDIAYELLNQWVLTSAFWDDYKAKHPFNYNLLSKTFTPAYIYNGQSGRFKSVSLPVNIQFGFGFGDSDTTWINYFIAQERQVKELYHQGNFLFDYLRDHKAYTCLVGAISDKVIHQIKAVYPDIIKYNYRQVRLLSIWSDLYRMSGTSTGSNWLLLPDGKVVLFRFSDKLIKTDNKVFGVFKPYIPVHRNNSTHYLCMVFDKNGNKIAGDESEIKIDLN